MRGASEESDEEYSKYFAGATERATKQTLAGTLSPNAARIWPILSGLPVARNREVGSAAGHKGSPYL